MRSLDEARDVCERYHPGMCAALADISLTEREAPDGTVLGMFRKFGGPGLLVPPEYGGMGVDALSAARIVRAMSSYSPSLGAATTMHHYTVATLFSLARRAGRLTSAQLELLAEIAPGNLIVASGWAEGKPGANIVIPAATARVTDGGYLVNGGKKPCSLARSMDLLTASAAVPVEGTSTLALLLIPASSPGISVHRFWLSNVLAGAESHEVRLADVFVPADMVIRTEPADPDRLDDLQTTGFAWFEMLATSVYVGAASALVEQALARGRGSVTDRAQAAIELESAVALVEGAARAIGEGLTGDAAVSTVLVARYAAQRALRAAGDMAAELLGGIAFMRSPDIGYLVAAVRPLAYHPPSRTAMAEALVDYFTGQPLRLS
ncbi:acyl-CoA dehydrogenase family protein [Actinomadura rudentiformis]|uniref:Acyl-CoA dehydrogenase n=1 Tax=Actinomadura rudentiformis TaxID=359158 RepID=A0A6H9YTF9_9ACTN|nr:acyl-CoA dehydrogenase family protein [Actinomadura rudentiformis]KAB2343693.1 acyl-CoA dehydrogenase [Actinomadura rudentiformis]